MTSINKPVLLFDLDGTLVDSAPDLATAVNKMLITTNLITFPTSIIRGWVGNGAKTLVQRALDQALFSTSKKTLSEPEKDKKITQALAIFLTHYQECVCEESTLYAGVKETLIALKAQGYRLAIITNKPAQFIAPIISGLGLDGLFELQLGGDSLAERKPHPLPLLHACQLLNVTVDDCVMIGDSKNDILAAKAANMQSIGLTYGYNYGENINRYQPDYCLDSFADLLPLFT